jgi:hypothetical protein
MKEDLNSCPSYLCSSVISVVKNLSGDSSIGNPLDAKLCVFEIEQ